MLYAGLGAIASGRFCRRSGRTCRWRGISTSRQDPAGSRSAGGSDSDPLTRASPRSPSVPRAARSPTCGQRRGGCRRGLVPRAGVYTHRLVGSASIEGSPGPGTLSGVRDLDVAAAPARTLWRGTLLFDRARATIPVRTCGTYGLRARIAGVRAYVRTHGWARGRAGRTDPVRVPVLSLRETIWLDVRGDQPESVPQGRLAQGKEHVSCGDT